jgi:hypothetical protein
MSRLVVIEKQTVKKCKWGKQLAFKGKKYSNRNPPPAL